MSFIETMKEKAKNNIKTIVLPEAEEIMAARDIVIAETNNLHTHICHISTQTSVNTIRSATAMTPILLSIPFT
mgnify:CR=1 FL=1